MISKVLTKKFPSGYPTTPGFFTYLSPPRACSLRCQIQLKIAKLPPNKRRLPRGCGCFMWFLLNEGHYFTTKTRKVGLAAKTPTSQLPTTGQSAKMKIRPVWWENLFFWPEVSFSQLQVFTGISQLRFVLICSSVHRSHCYGFLLEKAKIPLKPAVQSRYKRRQIIKSRITHPTSLCKTSERSVYC